MVSYVVKMCEYAAKGKVENIRLLARNGVDVSLGNTVFVCAWCGQANLHICKP